MNTNTGPETCLEKGKIHSGSVYSDLFNKMATYDKEFLQFLNKIILMGVELRKEKLENAKLEQELKETSSEFDNLYREMQSYCHEVEAHENKLTTYEEDCAQHVSVQKDSGQLETDDNRVVD